jgi:hypothetical protein
VPLAAHQGHPHLRHHRRNNAHLTKSQRRPSGLALHRGDVRFLQIAAQLTAEAAVALGSGSTSPWPEGADLANATLAIGRTVAAYRLIAASRKSVRLWRPEKWPPLRELRKQRPGKESCLPPGLTAGRAGAHAPTARKTAGRHGRNIRVATDVAVRLAASKSSSQAQRRLRA